ncbi:hypothetical protein ON010_g13029 [Phytophthora cinnamomi]|nr:hypothetical protein ON010_g13029 [Phytophthora cinnamomi]
MRTRPGPSSIANLKVNILAGPAGGGHDSHAPAAGPDLHPIAGDGASEAGVAQRLDGLELRAGSAPRHGAVVLRVNQRDDLLRHALCLLRAVVLLGGSCITSPDGLLGHTCSFSNLLPQRHISKPFHYHRSTLAKLGYHHHDDIAAGRLRPAHARHHRARQRQDAHGAGTAAAAPSATPEISP